MPKEEQADEKVIIDRTNSHHRTSISKVYGQRSSDTKVVARNLLVSCNETQYVNEELNTCCSRCPPGYFRKEHCTLEKDTLCLPCPAKTYAAKWNYARSCLTCYPCNSSKETTLVEKTPCSAIQAPVCVCPDGYYCSQHGAFNNRCELCKPNFTSTESPPDVEKIYEISMKPYWITIGLGLFMVTAVVIILCLKPSVLKRFGRMIKNKNCSMSTPQTETPATVDMEVVGGQERPLLKDIKKPMQEQGKDLNFPIQETSTDIGESTLLPKRGE
ncbi:tumor necrosis factor receptor superfamily member 3 isoform X2 [Hyla sarda]|uniref:tumor necrosis factor receptor superfamily member 3 isoform X2 n=1 Tax=Hyla sarda TaxID=327740 RepID=UPI0024C26C1C|nr:tumor necrosis factor receptor superfamily member 3 isoform X2 [Hyla sarda]